MGFFWTERLKETIGSDKEAVELYEQQTGKKVNNLYKDTFLGNNNQKGTLFEFYLFKHLYKIKGYHKFLFNVYLPTKNGTTEVDVIFLHEKGVFIFECKNYSGKVYGKQSSYQWTQYMNGNKHTFYNPIKQNEAHIRALKTIIPLEYKQYISFIVFSDRTELKVDYEPERLLVDSEANTISELNIALKKLNVCFSSQEIDEMYEKLLPYSLVSDDVKKTHIEEIQKLRNKKF